MGGMLGASLVLPFRLVVLDMAAEDAAVPRGEEGARKASAAGENAAIAASAATRPVRVINIFIFVILMIQYGPPDETLGSYKQDYGRLRVDDRLHCFMSCRSSCVQTNDRLTFVSLA